MYGQTLESKNFAASAIPISPEAAALWSSFRHQAERDKGTVPPCAAEAVGKHCFTTPSHIAACHLLQQAFLDIKQGRVDLDFLRAPSQAALDSIQLTCHGRTPSAPCQRTVWLRVDVLSLFPTSVSCTHFLNSGLLYVYLCIIVKFRSGAKYVKM